MNQVGIDIAMYGTSNAVPPGTDTIATHGMDAHLGTLSAALAVAERAYRSLQHALTTLPRLSTAADNQEDQHDDEGSRSRRHYEASQLASLVRDVSARLYQVHLTFSALDLAAADLDSAADDFNLGHVRRCHEILHRIASFSYVDPAQGSGACRLDPLLAPDIQEGLRQVAARLSMALVADTPFAVLRVLSEPERCPLRSHPPEEVRLTPTVAPDVQTPILPFKVRHRQDPAALARWAENRLNMHLRLRTPGSLDATLRLPLISRWLEGDSGHLWLHGARGSGKSVLAATIVERLITEARHDQSMAVCYCMFDASKDWSFYSWALLDTLVGQLAMQNPDASSVCQAAFRPDEYLTTGGEVRLPPYGDFDFQPILKSLQACYRKIFIVVDGYDSYSLTALKHLCWYIRAELSGPATSILVLASEQRPKSADVCSVFKRQGLFNLGAGQIYGFVQQRLLDRARSNPSVALAPAQINRIAESISSSHNVIRVAECQVDYLLSLHSDQERELAMGTLSTDLAVLYGLILDSSREPWLVQMTLGWLKAWQDEEVNIIVLSDALSVLGSPHAKSLSEMRAVTERQILRHCGALVRTSSDGSMIEVAHRVIFKLLPLTYPDPRQELGLACLRFLNLADFAREPEAFSREEEHVRRRAIMHPFYHYAAQVLPLVLERTSGAIRKALKDEAYQALMDEAYKLFSSPISGNLTSWLLEVARHHLQPVYSIPWPRLYVDVVALLTKSSVAPLHIAACLAIPSLCVALVERGSDVNLGSGCGSPLYCAIAGPVLLVSGVSQVTWESARKVAHDAYRNRTIDALLRLGARSGDTWPRSSRHPSFVAMTLMSCARAGCLGLFKLLCDDERHLSDEEFLSTFRDSSFPYESADREESTEEETDFLNELCEFLIDVCWMKPSLQGVWDAAWEKGSQYRLKCTDTSTRRELPLDDTAFADFMMETMKLCYEPHIRRLMQDSRWDANAVLTEADDSGRGETFLHRAVELGDEALVRLLLAHGGAEFLVFDEHGRTPLHLCETGRMLRLLLIAGADLSWVDDDGRTLWHYAAANNEVEMLQALVESGDDLHAALRRVTKKGRTPLAEAFAHVRRLTGRSTLFPSYATYYQDLGRRCGSIMLLLRHCKQDPAFLRSDIPVLCYAAEWGLPSLVATLRARFSSLELVTAEGDGPLHFLNFIATADLIREIRLVPGVSQLPAQNHAGQTPAETIFLAFKPSNVTRDPLNEHPSNYGNLDKQACRALLTDDVCKSRDHNGRTLWERFCQDIVLHYAALDGWMVVEMAMEMVVDCFVESGVIDVYETCTQSSALMLWVKYLWQVFGLDVPVWGAPVYVRLVQGTTKFHLLKDRPDVIMTLRSSIDAEDAMYDHLAAELLSRGVSIREPT